MCIKDCMKISTLSGRFERMQNLRGGFKIGYTLMLTNLDNLADNINVEITNLTTSNKNHESNQSLD